MDAYSLTFAGVMPTGARVTVAGGLTLLAAGACLAASTAILTWAESDGTAELPDLIAQAFDTLANPGRARMS